MEGVETYMIFPSEIFPSSSKWSLFNVIVEIVITLKPWEFIQWFVLTIISMTLTSYVNISFFTTILINVDQGLKYLFLLIIFENITSYWSLKQRLAKRIFVLDFLEHFRTKLNQRILSTHWIKIKLSDQEDIRQKIERACSSVQYLLEDIIDKLKEIYKFLLTIMIILYICPISTVLIGIIYISSYCLYLNKQSTNLLDIKANLLEKHNKLHSKYTSANTNMFEYVIHHEKNKIIQITNQLKVAMERQWYLHNHLYDYVSFKEDILGKILTLIVIVIYYILYGTNTFIIQLYHYLSTLTNTIHKMIIAYIQWVKFKKDYDLVQPILEEYQERISVEQIDLYNGFQIQDLSFRYKDTREDFHLHYNGSLTFKRGESILIKGNSGAGNID